jgi:hypothetical protein
LRGVARSARFTPVQIDLQIFFAQLDTGRTAIDDADQTCTV